MKSQSILKFLLVMLSFITCNGFSQPITFSKVYNFGATSTLCSVQQTSDSGYIASGYNNRNYEDAYILKLNKFGDTIWTKSYGYAYRDWAQDIQITSDGGYIVAGRKNYYVNIEQGSMYGDIWILKLKSNGDTLWTKTYGGQYNDYANSIKQTFDGGYIVAGAKDNYGINKSSKTWILKLDQNGDTLWTKTFHLSAISEAKSIIQTLGGDFVFTGTGNVFKLSYTGDSIWCKSLNSFNGNDIIQSNDSNFITAGFFNNSDDKIIKLDSTGNVVWENRYSPSQGYYYKSNSLAINKSGDIISVGQRINTNDVRNTPDDLWIKKNLSNGNRVWTNYFDFSLHDIGNSVKATNDNGFIIAGTTNQNAWLLKLDRNCDLSLNVDSVYNLISGNWYKVIECIGFTGKCDSVYSEDLNQIERITGTDSITWKVFQKGNLVDQSKYKISYSYSNTYQSYKWMLIDDGGPRMIIYSSQNSFSVGIDAIDGGGYGYSRNKSTVGIISRAINNSELLFFPNPVRSEFSVKGVPNIESIKLYALDGKLLESKGNPDNQHFDISKYPQGIYFVHVITKSQTYIGKIIKE